MTGATLARLAAAVLSTEKGRKTVGWVIAAILSPLILLAAFLCSFGTAAVEHNNFAVSASFYGPAFTDKIPTEYKDHITEMRTAFSLLDSAVAAVNAKAESGGLDPLQVKAIFYALCFGDDAPTRRAAANFVGSFYSLEERTETTTDVLEDGTVVVQTTVYYVAVPLPLETVYEKLAAWQGEPVTEEDKANAAHIYSMVVGSTGGDTFDGNYTPGGGSGVELDISDLTNPTTKNAADLVAYVTNAWQSGWGYVWGTYGQVLTPELFQYKLTQYPEGVGQYADFIRNNWLGKHTADCVGLIKGYGWLNTETMEIEYGTNGMPDIGANHMDDWQAQNYVACCGTTFAPVEQMLRTYPQIRQVYLCLDNDEAGHNASERMEGYLRAEGISAMRLVPVQKDWNEDLMAQEVST